MIISLQDAVTFLKSDLKYRCAGLGGGGEKDRCSSSVSAEVQVQQNGGDVSADGGRRSVRVTKNGSLQKPRRPHLPSDCYMRQPSKTDSIMDDLAAITIPDTLPEAFGDDDDKDEKEEED